ncbi:MAG: hypothetical protein Q4A30_00300 [Candidatus Saccharibacteria bacterium]|nr:hypothetical protein [Candidatus Saccharibacteria bacterium]
MIQLFYGDDRIKAQAAILRQLGPDHEIIDGELLTPTDLPTLFSGTSLFSSERRILVKDLLTNKDIVELLPRYLNSPHQIILWEKQFDKRTTFAKIFAKQGEIQEFKLPLTADANLAFTLYDLAIKGDFQKILPLFETAKSTEDPYRLLGAWSWKAIDQYKKSPTTKTKRVLLELSRLDMQLKSGTLATQPWLLLQSFLLRASSL